MFLTTGKETYGKGEKIFKEGSYGSAVYIIESGKVEISKRSHDKKIVVDVLGAGELFGEMSFFDPQPRSATAIALEDTVVELLDKDFLDREFNQISSDFRKIISQLVKRLRNTTQRLAQFTGHQEERVKANIKITFKKASDLYKAYIGNIGIDGLFISSTKVLPKDTILNLEFNLPGTSKIIHTQGKVVWTRSEVKQNEKGSPGMGVQFISMNQEDQKLLEHFISSFKKP